MPQNFLPSLIVALSFFSTAQGAIYGKDDRQDVLEVPSLRNPASAVAVAVGNPLISQNADGTSRIEIYAHYSDWVCPDERFFRQTSLGVCTGFLISDRLLVSAGHCALPTGTTVDPAHAFCESFSWYFGYFADGKGATDDQAIPADHLYKCQRLIRAENIERDPATGEPGNDFLIVELDRPVVKTFMPAKIAKRPVNAGESVYTIGFPTGLPAKYSGRSPIRGNSKSVHFEVNLDTSSGNSGGPVFNDQDEIVGILVSGHPTDFYRDPWGGCDRPNVCDDEGKNCKGEVPFPGQQTGNFVQRIEKVIPYLPGK